LSPAIPCNADLAGAGRGNGNGRSRVIVDADAGSGSAWRRAKRPGDQGLKGYIFIAGVLIYSVFPAPRLPRGRVSLLTPRADEMRKPASMNEA